MNYNEIGGNLTPFNHSVLIGLMLGDGSIYRSSPSGNSRLEFSFGTKYQPFAESIALIFKDYISNSLKEIKIKGKNKEYINYRLKTASLPLFNKYYDLFYRLNENGKFVKIVPLNIKGEMNAIVLAYMIMTDGNFQENRKRVRIYTNSYKKAEVEMLAEAIQAKLNIYVGVLHDRNDQWILTIGARQLELLRNLTSQYFEPSMLYRLGVKPSTSL